MPLAAGLGQLAYAHSSCAITEGLLPHLHKSEILKVKGVPESHLYTQLIRNKGTLIEPKTGKDSPTQGDKPGTGCMGTVSLGKEVFQTKAPFFSG